MSHRPGLVAARDDTKPGIKANRHLWIPVELQTPPYIRRWAAPTAPNELRALPGFCVHVGFAAHLLMLLFLDRVLLGDAGGVW